MNTPVTSDHRVFGHQRTFRGAKVREVAEKMATAVVLHPQVEHHGVIGYEVAREGAKRKKNWARRWFKAHKQGSFYP